MDKKKPHQPLETHAIAPADSGPCTGGGMSFKIVATTATGKRVFDGVAQIQAGGLTNLPELLAATMQSVLRNSGTRPYRLAIEAVLLGTQTEG